MHAIVKTVMVSAHRHSVPLGWQEHSRRGACVQRTPRRSRPLGNFPGAADHLTEITMTRRRPPRSVERGAGLGCRLPVSVGGVLRVPA